MKKGFTMLELIVVFGLIAVLSSFAVSFLETPRSTSRDARAVEDINQLVRALQLYHIDHSVYPGGDELGAGSGSFGFLVTGGYITSMPTDNQQYQGLLSKGGGACEAGGQCAYYHLAVKLQNTSSPALKNDADSNVSGLPSRDIDGISNLGNCANDFGNDLATDLCYDVTP
ncbi:MAG: prepilin-type N-terminal cleavage/methylation domain-containing protein [Candidatus Vogelbacteria bacterium]|nr:prepilin-type N-terminal cleavage/methylation domain-containing protein [Candidatus Vogelbacteria bacterium]